MTGSTSCYRRRTFGPPLQPGVRSTRKSQRKHSAKSGKGCRLFICGWMSSYGGGCSLTECTSLHLLGNPKQNSMPCSLTKLLDATEKTLMKRRSTVEPESKRSEHGGRAVEIGWKAIEPMVNRFFFSWMLHGSTKVVVRAVALLSANTRINRMSLSKVVYVSEATTENLKQRTKLKTQTSLQSPREWRGFGCNLFLGIFSRASWQHREHACQPSEGEGILCSRCMGILQSLNDLGCRKLRL